GDRELLPMAEALGLGATLWSPLGGGFLTGKYREKEETSRLTKLGMLVHTEKSARETALLDAVLAVAKEVGTTPTHIAIAWLLEKSARSTAGLIPILGSRTRTQLDDTLGAVEVKLTPEQVAKLDAASAVPLGIPHDQLRETAPGLAGGKLDLLDLPRVPVA
ncbi:MAG: aldo/keto reductase, partial [Hypericibacter sp.]